MACRAWTCIVIGQAQMATFSYQWESNLSLNASTVTSLSWQMMASNPSAMLLSAGGIEMANGTYYIANLSIGAVTNTVADFHC